MNTIIGSKNWDFDIESNQTFQTINLSLEWSYYHEHAHLDRHPEDCYDSEESIELLPENNWESKVAQIDPVNVQTNINSIHWQLEHLLDLVPLWAHEQLEDYLEERAINNWERKHDHA